MGALDFLVVEGFFTGDELNDALAHLQDDTRVRSRKVRRVVKVVERLKAS